MRGTSKDIDDISVSGRYGITSEDTYKIRLSFINNLELEITVNDKKQAKLQNFMQFTSNILILHELKILTCI